MDDNYIRSMQRNENRYMEFMNKAEQAYDENNGVHSKEECYYLQQAAMCQMEMANLSIGEEKLHHQRQLREINKKIETIVRCINPDAYRQLQEKKKMGSGAGSTEGGSKAPGSGAPAKPSAAVDDQSVAAWFKPAPKHSFEDVVGMEELKTQLKGCIADSKLAKLKSYLGMKNLHSYFFIGPPGCGKTFIIEAFAHELMDKDYKYLSLVGSDILSKYVGEAEKIITRLFEEAEKNAPCIVFIDEIDGVCKNRSLPNLPEYAASITTAFLTGYNRINSSDKQIIFIGATNYPDQVDNAMLDRVELVRVPLPDLQTRSFAFRQKFQSVVQTDPDLTWESMADKTDNYNQRDITRLVNRIKDLMIRKLADTYDNEDRAIEALKSGSFKLTRELFEQARKECLPTPKDDMLKALDRWEEKFKSGMEE